MDKRFKIAAPYDEPVEGSEDAVPAPTTTRYETGPDGRLTKITTFGTSSTTQPPANPSSPEPLGKTPSLPYTPAPAPPPPNTTPSSNIWGGDYEASTPTLDAKKDFQEEVRKNKSDALALKNKSDYSDFTKTILSKELFDNNLYAIQIEIERLEKNLPRDQKNIIDFSRRSVSVSQYKSTLKNQLRELQNKQEYGDLEASSIVAGSTGQALGVSPGPDASEWKGRKDLESLARLIRQREENIADLEGYIFGLVTGVEQFTAFAPNIAHTNAKFIKTSEELVKEADEVIEDYYNELYDGDPNFGTALEHFEENRNKATKDITKHSSNKKLYKFRKK